MFFNQSRYENNCDQIDLQWIEKKPFSSFQQTIKNQSSLAQTPVMMPISTSFNQQDQVLKYFLQVRYGSHQTIYHKNFSIIFTLIPKTIAYGGYSFSLETIGPVIQIIKQPSWLRLAQDQKSFLGKIENIDKNCEELEFFSRMPRGNALVSMEICPQASNPFYLAFITYYPCLLTLYIGLAIHLLIKPIEKNQAIQQEIQQQKPKWLHHHASHFVTLLTETISRYLEIRAEKDIPTSKNEMVQQAFGMLFCLRPYPLIKKQISICIDKLLSRLDYGIEGLNAEQRAAIVNQAAFSCYMHLHHDFAYYDQLCDYFNTSKLKMIMDNYSAETQHEVYQKLSVALSDQIIIPLNIHLINDAKSALISDFVSPDHYCFPITQQQYLESVMMYFKQNAAIAEAALSQPLSQIRLG